MPWFRLDDGFDMHPKVLAAGNEAAGLFIRCGTYCARHLTDGYIRRDIVNLYGSPDLAEKLVAVGLFHRTKHGWRIHDYLHYNPSKKKVSEQRKLKADRQKRWLDGKSRRVSSASLDASGDAAPSRPIKPEISLADVVTSRSVVDARTREPRDVIEAIRFELADVTGRMVSDEWARLVARELVKGQHIANPVAYVRQCIRNEPNPRIRFLPLYDDPKEIKNAP